MKKRINLYLPELRPKRQPLSLFQLVLAWGSLFALLLLAGGGLQMMRQQSARQQQVLQQQLSVLDAQTKTLTAQLQSRHSDAALERELKLRQEEVRSKQQLLVHLDQIGTLQNQGFSAWLYDLAQAHSPGIALQSFDIENDQLRLQGEAASNDAVPAWLSRFGDYPTLRDRAFSALEVQRQPSGTLQFRLESRAASAAQPTASAATGKQP